MVVDGRDVDTPDQWIPRHPELIRLNGRHPFNCEAPLDLLFKKGFITPSSLHYVRSHGAAPKSFWHAHALFIGGLAPTPIKLTMNDLLKLPRHSLPVTRMLFSSLLVLLTTMTTETCMYVSHLNPN